MPNKLEKFIRLFYTNCNFKIVKKKKKETLELCLHIFYIVNDKALINHANSRMKIKLLYEKKKTRGKIKNFVVETDSGNRENYAI